MNDDEFMRRVTEYVKGACAKHNARPIGQPHDFSAWTISYGRMFVAIRRPDESAHSFIAMKDCKIGGLWHKKGDILKPATWRAPAKHARGNIYDNDYGLSKTNWFGPEYLR